nr:CoA pyrophosphatase [uncultured Roseateles sp.]
MTVPIFDPHAVPVISRDEHLPALSPERMTPAFLRQRFRDGADWLPEIPGDGRMSDREPAQASVLVPLVLRESGLTVLLTRRTAHLRAHAGQISFPGGRVEAHDFDPVATALRETEEEVGLSHDFVEVIGQLPIYTTVTAFQVTPVVGLVRPGFTLTLDTFEVDEAFEVPLQFLMTPAHHQRHQVDFDGGRRQFLSMPWTGPDAAGAQREYFIWGATAAMLRNFYRFLAV